MFVILCILSCYYNSFVSIFTIGCSSMSTSFSGCLLFCVKLVLCYYCLLNLWRNKYYNDDDDDRTAEAKLQTKHRAASAIVDIIQCVANIRLA